MQAPDFPPDDLLDVIEMTTKIETYIANVLDDHESNIALSVLIGVFTNCMIAECETLDEFIFSRNLFMEVLDNSIRAIRIHRPENPTSS
jgi:hypothetical protein